MSLRVVLRPKSIALDAVLVAVVIVGANLLFDRAHPGWINLNPSPYLLLPILLGSRYGFVPGILAGLTASVLIVAHQLLAAALLPTALPSCRRRCPQRSAPLSRPRLTSTPVSFLPGPSAVNFLAGSAANAPKPKRSSSDSPPRSAASIPMSAICAA